MKQAEKMRELFRLHREVSSFVIQAYSEAEQRGEVVRKSNVNGLTSSDYAAKLFADGIRKGWINERDR